MLRDNWLEYKAIIISVIGHIIVLGIIIFGISFNKPPPKLTSLQTIKVKMVSSKQLKKKYKEKKTRAPKKKSPTPNEVQQKVREKLAQENKEKEEIALKKKMIEIQENKAKAKKKKEEFKLKESKEKEKKKKIKEKQDKKKEKAKKRKKDRAKRKKKREQNRAKKELQKKIAKEEKQENNEKPTRTRAQNRKMELLKHQYKTSITQQVQRRWLQPANMSPDSFCEVMVTQLPSGDVQDIEIIQCNADDIFIRSVEQAILKASPLPLPKKQSLFDPEIRFTFKPQP